MAIKVNRIPVALVKQGELDLSLSVDAQTLDLVDENNNGPDKYDLSGRVYAVDSEIIADLTVRCDKQTTCSRCSESFGEEFNKKYYIVESSPESKYWNLARLVREEILLEDNIVNLCSANCKGLCATCGQNLNKGKCKCL
ncbi:MAG: hypothetical protein ACI9CF_000084 [Candidatus Omnitrophota bacterium]|jgi:uncharacterized protein